jgi:Uma2 family endonuclease
MLKTKAEAQSDMVVLRLNEHLKLTPDEFFELAQSNPELRLEQTAEGDIEILPPAGGGTSRRNLKLSRYVDDWAEQDGTGVTFESSGGFRLPNGATRSPDTAWVLKSRLATLKSDQKERFLPLCPDFVIELRSPSDSLEKLQDKMEEYLANGARLGWLIDPSTHRVYVYRPDADVEELDKPTHVSGDPVLPGFTLDLQPIWEPGF